MRIIAIANQKGGCAKTTTAINLCGCLALEDRKALLIDMDPQAHASLGLNVKTDELEQTMYEVLMSSNTDQVNIDDITLEMPGNFDLAPTDIVLSVAEQVLAGTPGRENRLRDSIHKMRRQYDYIVIDCPPSIGLLTFNALNASKEVIVPVETSFFCLHGLTKLRETISIFKERGHSLEMRVLATMYDRRTKFAKTMLQDMRKQFGEKMFETVINSTVKLREAIEAGRPISIYAKQSKGFQDYMALARELIANERKEELG